jgi:hypothetical protein
VFAWTGHEFRCFRIAARYEWYLIASINDLQVLEPIKRALNSADFTFVDALIECEGDSEIVKYYSGPFYRHWDETEGTVVQACEYLLDIIEDEGPFDGVIGFSQGAAAAASLILYHQRQHVTEPPLFQLAIFFCATRPLDADGAASSRSKASTDLLPQIPTVHIVGQQDELKEQSMSLFAIAEGQYAKLLSHNAGHVIPKDAAFTRKVLDAIEWAVLAGSGGG